MKNFKINELKRRKMNTYKDIFEISKYDDKITRIVVDTSELEININNETEINFNEFKKENPNLKQFSIQYFNSKETLESLEIPESEFNEANYFYLEIEIDEDNENTLSFNKTFYQLCTEKEIYFSDLYSNRYKSIKALEEISKNKKKNVLCVSNTLLFKIDPSNFIKKHFNIDRTFVDVKSINEEMLKDVNNIIIFNDNNDYMTIDSNIIDKVNLFKIQTALDLSKVTLFERKYKLEFYRILAESQLEK